MDTVTQPVTRLPSDGAPTLALRIAVLSGQVPLEYASLVAGMRRDASRLLEDALWAPRTTEDA